MQINNRLNYPKIIIALLLGFICFQSFAMAMGTKNDEYTKGSYVQDQAKAQQIVETISAVEVLGPLSAVSLSPFFGITCLSGTSMFAEKLNIDNNFLTGNDALGNPLVFVAFAALTLLTSLPKLTTVTKGFAELTDQVETYAGIISYLVIYAIANADLSQQPEQQVVYAAGIFTFTKQTLLMAACVVNIIVINTVKFFFELLAFISPIPTLDAIFEICVKGLTAFFVMVYAFNPWLSFLMNVILFLVCLAIFGWTKRRTKYLRAILLDPIWTSMIRNMFGKADYNPDDKIKNKLKLQLENIELIVKAFPAKKIKHHKIKKKQLIYLISTNSAVHIAKPHMFSHSTINKLETDGLKISTDKGILSNSITFSNSEGKQVYKFTCSKIYSDMLEKIQNKLNPNNQSME